MRGRSKPPMRAAWLGMVLMMTTLDASATLGQRAFQSTAAASAPQASSLKKLNSTLGTAATPYEVVEVILENGTSVTEYSRADGLVFAVAWSGPVLPDLKVLLGAYFQTFQQETAQARLSGKRGGPMNVNTEGLVVHSGGHMRQFFGHAYAPALVPADVVIQDVLP